MTFEEAMVHMRSGEYVRRRQHGDTYRWSIKTDDVGIIHLYREHSWCEPQKDGGWYIRWTGISGFISGDCSYVDISNLLADDWEVYYPQEGFVSECLE